MDYDLPLYRPPSEAQNLILQVTLGCSHNLCTFCSMYREKSFVARPLAAVEADLRHAARLWPEARQETLRVFFADGDAFTLPTDHLLAICAQVRAAFPQVQRMSAYATPANLLKKSEQELLDLRAAGLSLAYVGVESGNDGILQRIRKGATGKSIVQAIHKAQAAGIKVSATVILGLGGEALWREHIDATAEVLAEAAPTYASTLQLTLEDDRIAPFQQDFARKDGLAFVPRSDHGVLEELERFLSRCQPVKPVIFRSNHASNALPLAGNLPKDSEKLLALVRAALNGQAAVRPWWMRGL